MLANATFYILSLYLICRCSSLFRISNVQLQNVIPYSTMF